MATDFEILLPQSLEAGQIDAAVLALEMLEPIEAALTVYQKESEVSRLNRQAFHEPVKVGPLVLDILQHAVRLSAATQGAFDVTAGPLIDAWGFTTRSGRRPTAEQIRTARGHVGWQHLEIDPEASTVRFGVPEMRINLGAIGKGYALDRIAARLRSAGIGDFLLHGGNSSLIAAGSAIPASDPPQRPELSSPPQASPPQSTRLGSPAAEDSAAAEPELQESEPRESGWRVGLRHPTRTQRHAGGITLRDMALATSGSGKQHFHFRGRRYGHVIDPRSGYPAGDYLSLSVLAPAATDADAIATGLFVGSRALIERYAAEHPEHGIIAVAAGEREGSTRTETWNVSSDVWSPHEEETG